MRTTALNADTPWVIKRICYGCVIAFFGTMTFVSQGSGYISEE